MKYIKLIKIIKNLRMKQNKYKTTTTYKSLYSLLSELNGRIDLNPHYQRGNVWKLDKQTKYIESLYNGIAPMPIIFNYSDGKLTCMDGKQRLTSIKEFCNNEFAFEMNDDIIFYNAINKNRLTKDQLQNKIRTFTKDEKNNFDLLNVPVIEYRDLDYSQQVDIFHRIQNGVALTSGELITTLFTKESLSEAFSKFCDGKLKVLRSYGESKRKNHHQIIANALYIVSKGILKDIHKSEKMDFFHKLENVKELKEYMENTSEIIDIVYGNDLLNHSDFKKNVKKNVQLSLIHFISNKRDDTINFGKLRKVVLDLKDTGSSTVTKDLKSLYSEIEKEYNNDDDSSSEEEVVPKKKKKTLVVKGRN